MSDLDLQTIRRYLEEMGFPDLPDEQVLALQKDVMSRLKQEPEQEKQNKFTRNQFDESDDQIDEIKQTNDTPSPPQNKQKQNNDFQEEEISDDTKFARLYSNKQKQSVQQEDQSDSDEYVPVFQKQTRKPVDKKPIKIAKEDLLRQQLLDSSSEEKVENYKPQQSQYSSTYQNTLRTTGHTRINGLLGPNQYTLSEKKKRKADPVSNFHKYQARWSIQGAPQERKQRNWSNKQKDVQKTTAITTGRYYE